MPLPVAPRENAEDAFIRESPTARLYSPVSNEAGEGPEGGGGGGGGGRGGAGGGGAGGCEPSDPPAPLAQAPSHKGEEDRMAANRSLAGRDFALKDCTMNFFLILYGKTASPDNNQTVLIGIA